MKSVLLLLNRVLFITLLLTISSYLMAAEEKTAVICNEEETAVISSEDEAKKLFLFQHLNMPEDSDAKDAMVAKIFSNFGLLPYEKNFLIPFAYTTANYEQRDLVAHPGYEQFNKNIEAEFQISLKKDISYNLFGLNEIITLGYTQEVWWQFYSVSAPFRETNYRPEIFLTLPIQDKKLSEFGFRAIKVGFWHESNGMGAPLSREWNQIYFDTIFYRGDLMTTLRLWISDAGDDNKNITSYLGYGHLKLNYFLKKHQFDLTWRNNLRFNGSNRGSLEMEWSHPIGHSKNTFWYIKLFNGYGASLVDYNNHQNRVGFGFSFSR
ncbi:phospholipase A [Sulfurimonas sp.]|uniref:phospholipase A n=1 Tax=Sulfurimonas sp. TaxID=2022749 RepID=UPI0025D7A06D|nr:phospholipase A [Sulfurimonas sp.]MCK9472912.1 phospholipase A [Sulfurimonas sp.]MDD3506665.1 phospholipase A [Sulfurimonas sp.]